MKKKIPTVRIHCQLFVKTSRSINNLIGKINHTIPHNFPKSSKIRLQIFCFSRIGNVYFCQEFPRIIENISSKF